MVRAPSFLLATMLALPATVRAVVYDAVIDEVMAGFNGDSTVQYVEIRMRSAGQNLVSDSRIGFFKCDGTTLVSSVIPGDVPNSGADVRWLMASPSFEAAFGVKPDFVITMPMTPPDRYPCGMVCWGNPTTASSANQYSDCVAYGDYHGTTPGSSIPQFAGTATSLAPGDGTMSLTRISDTQNNSVDFALRPPTPTNNSVIPTTTTTPGATTTTGSTTTTTFPPGGPATNPVPGGGPAISDCYVELDVLGATDIRANKVVTCTDGDPCDADGASDGTCTFKVAVCPNQSLPGCTTHPPVTLSGKSLGAPLIPPTDLSGSGCGPFADVAVKLRKSGKKPGKTVLHVTAKSSGKPKTDRDNVKLICKPRTST